MASLNKVQFIGNAGGVPEVRQFDNGNKVAQVRIAVTERYTDRNGQPQESTEWIPLIFNGKLADIAAQYIQKGTSVYVEGKWKTRKWTDQQGVERYSTEVRVDNMQLLSPRQQAQQPAQQQAPAAPPQYQQAPPQYNQPAPPPQQQYRQAPPAPQYAATPQPQYQQPAPAPAAPAVDPNLDLPFDSAPGVRA